MSDYLDSDGYPTDEALEKVKRWLPEKGWHPLMAFVESLWRYGAPYWSRRGSFYRISTGGWSGNEDLVEALHCNYTFWGFCWESSRRGGHYVFRVRKEFIYAEAQDSDVVAGRGVEPTLHGA